MRWRFIDFEGQIVDPSPVYVDIDVDVDEIASGIRNSVVDDVPVNLIVSCQSQIVLLMKEWKNLKLGLLITLFLILKFLVQMIIGSYVLRILSGS